MNSRKLCKSTQSRMVCGVCGGIAEYFNIDPTIVRLIFVVLNIFPGSSVALYIIAAIIMPNGH